MPADLPPGTRIVLTRQPVQAGRLEQDLREAGCTVGFLPLTDFELPADFTELRGALERLNAGDYAWLLLTSPNSARALARVGWDGTLPSGTQVAVTGPGTARVLAQVGCLVTPWMPDGDQSAAGIAAEFPAGPGGQGGQVLLPQSQLASDEVPTGLRSLGWSVDRVEAYRTVPYPADAERRLLSGTDPLLAGDEDVVGLEDVEGAVVVLTSPSAVREVTRQAQRSLHGVRWVAIGQPTRQAAEQAGLQLLGTARTPDARGILDVLRGVR